MTTPTLIEMAERFDAFNQKLNRIIDNPGGAMTVGGQATAIGMLATLNLQLFEDVAASLRALAVEGGGRMTTVLGRCAASRRRSAGLRPEPHSAVCLGLTAAAANAGGDA